MQMILDPIVSLVALMACVAVIAVLSALLLIDRLEQRNIMLTKRVERLERKNKELIDDLHEWRGFPRTLLESDLGDGR